MTADSIFEKVRRLVGDQFEPYRFERAELRDHLRTALRRLNALVPSTRYVGGALTDGTALPELDADEIAVPDCHEEALVYYVVHLCYGKDDPDTSNAELSNAYLAKAERLMA